MPLQRPIVLGNWKMNGLRHDGLALAGAVAAKAARLSGTVGIFPPAVLIAQVASRMAGAGVVVGGQDCHHAASGAFTGSTSATMLKDAGAKAVLVGHSERRHGLGETDSMVKAKAEAALAEGLLTVICIGETEAEYSAGRTIEVLTAQLSESLPDQCDAEQIVVAYEPVWAIGTGRTPTIAEIDDIHQKLRAIIKELRTGFEPALLYGGSVKPDNAADILRLDAVDGALVGGASLDIESFWGIYTAGGGA